MSRLIDGDTLEEVLEMIPSEDIKNIDGQAYVLVRLSQVLNVIKNAPTIETEQRWIPVSERLPEDKTAYYLVTLGNFGDFYVYHEEIDIARWDYDRRKGKDSWHWCKERTVTAWKPLPKPYQEEGENR